MSFTAQELAEMAEFDAQIENEYCELTEEEQATARHIDAVALDCNEGAKADFQRSYYQQHREEILERARNMPQERRERYNAYRKSRRDAAVPNQCLKSFRTGTGLSAPQFAQAIKVPYATYRNWERGYYGAKDNIIGFTFPAYWKHKENWKGN